MRRRLVKEYQKRYGIKSRLRGYQRKAASLGSSIPDYALLMDPRLGKTRVDVAVAGYRFLNSGLTRWVIICPVIAMDVWKTEIEQTLDIPYQLEILEGRISDRSLAVRKWTDDPGSLSIVIMNFEATWRIKKFLYKFNPGKVTVDESHRIANHASNQSRTIHHLGKRADYRCILTGTFLSKPTDCFSQYKFLDPSVFGAVWKSHPRKPQPSFLGEYVKSWGYGGHRPETFKNLDRMQEKIHSIAFQLTRAQAGGFPKEHCQTIKFKLTNPALKHYREMEKDLRTMVSGYRVSAEIVLTQLLRLQQITGGYLPIKDPTDEDLKINSPLGSDRVDSLMELIREYPMNEPLVIFAKFRYEISSILDGLKKMGRTHSPIVGGLKTRPQVIRDFQSGKVDTCVAQIRAAGISVDLSRANTAIFYTTSGFLDYEQAKARIIARTGGHKSFIRMAAMGTLDEQALEALDTGSSLVKLILERDHLHE